MEKSASQHKEVTILEEKFRLDSVLGMSRPMNANILSIHGGRLWKAWKGALAQKLSPWDAHTSHQCLPGSYTPPELASC